MNKILLPIISGCIIASFFLSCTENKTEEDCTSKSTINPNGDSELALLMRELYNLSDSIKSQNKQHKPVDIESIKKILANLKTAVPTDSSVHGDVFNAFADRLTLEFNSIESDSNFIFTFNNMVNSCVDCHNEFCPGPIKKINKLKITE